MRCSAILLAILLGLGGLVACGDDDDDGGDEIGDEAGEGDAAADDFDRVVAFYEGWVAEQPETYTEDPVSETGAGWRPEEGSGSPVQNIIVAKTLGDDREEITLVNISIVP